MLPSNDLQIGDLIYYKKYIPKYNKEEKIYGVILNKLIKNEILHYKIFFFNSNDLIYFKFPIPHFWCYKVENIDD